MTMPRESVARASRTGFDHTPPRCVEPTRVRFRPGREVCRESAPVAGVYARFEVPALDVQAPMR